MLLVVCGVVPSSSGEVEVEGGHLIVRERRGTGDDVV